MSKQVFGHCGQKTANASPPNRKCIFVRQAVKLLLHKSESLWITKTPDAWEEQVAARNKTEKGCSGSLCVTQVSDDAHEISLKPAVYRKYSACVLAFAMRVCALFFFLFYSVFSAVKSHSL